MALDDKKYEKFYNTTGTGKDKATSDELAKIEALWDLDKADGCEYFIGHPEFGPLIFQMQQMQDEITALRDEISDNKDKAGVTTTQSDRITANHAKVGITTSQASAISANTAKTGITTSQASAITANTTKVTFPITYAADGHELAFAVDKNGTGLTISNTFTEKGKKVTKTVSILMS